LTDEIEIEELVFRQPVANLTTGRLMQNSPITGIAHKVLIHFPAGCNSLVEVFVNYKRSQIFPYGTTGIALDDATHNFAINQRVTKDEPLEVVVINHDTVNPHTIVTTIEIEGRGK